VTLAVRRAKESCARSTETATAGSTKRNARQRASSWVSVSTKSAAKRVICLRIAATVMRVMASLAAATRIEIARHVVVTATAGAVLDRSHGVRGGAATIATARAIAAPVNALGPTGRVAQSARCHAVPNAAFRRSSAGSIPTATTCLTAESLPNLLNSSSVIGPRRPAVLAPADLAGAAQEPLSHGAVPICNWSAGVRSTVPDAAKIEIGASTGRVAAATNGAKPAIVTDENAVSAARPTSASRSGLAVKGVVPQKLENAPRPQTYFEQYK